MSMKQLKKENSALKALGWNTECFLDLLFPFYCDYLEVKTFQKHCIFEPKYIS